MLEKGKKPCPQDDPLCSLSNGANHLGIIHRNNGNSHTGTVVERPTLFAGILPGDYTKIAAGARVKEFTRGEMLYIEGDTVRQVLLLTSGFAKMTKLGMSGTEVLLRFCVPGDALGAAGLFSCGKHCTTAQAFRLCRALVWDAPAFKALVERFPVLHQNMARILSEDLLELEERFHEVATERVGPRVARQLVRLQEKIGRAVNGAIEIGLSREELAQMTGTTLFTVSRLLSAWEARGIVKARREAVTICDVQSVRAIGRGDESSCSAEAISGWKPMYQKAFSAAG
jgi:CRP/FNR family transcriptional regulator, nitrogen oxide reductase regulator